MTPKQLNALMTAPGARCPIDWNDDNLRKPRPKIGLK